MYIAYSTCLTDVKLSDTRRLAISQLQLQRYLGTAVSKQPRVKYRYGYALWVLGVLGPAGAEVF